MNRPLKAAAILFFVENGIGGMGGALTLFLGSWPDFFDFYLHSFWEKAQILIAVLRTFGDLVTATFAVCKRSR